MINNLKYISLFLLFTSFALTGMATSGMSDNSNLGISPVSTDDMKASPTDTAATSDTGTTTDDMKASSTDTAAPSDTDAVAAANTDSPSASNSTPPSETIIPQSASDAEPMPTDKNTLTQPSANPVSQAPDSGSQGVSSLTLNAEDLAAQKKAQDNYAVQSAEQQVQLIQQEQLAEQARLAEQAQLTQQAQLLQQEQFIEQEELARQAQFVEQQAINIDGYLAKVSKNQNWEREPEKLMVKSAAHVQGRAQAAEDQDRMLGHEKSELTQKGMKEASALKAFPEKERETENRMNTPLYEGRNAVGKEETTREPTEKEVEKQIAEAQAKLLEIKAKKARMAGKLKTTVEDKGTSRLASRENFNATATSAIKKKPSQSMSFFQTENSKQKEVLDDDEHGNPQIDENEKSKKDFDTGPIYKSLMNKPEKKNEEKPS